MTTIKPDRIVFDDDSIFDKNLTDKLLNNYLNAIWALKMTDELIFELTPAMRQEILENYACWFVDWVLEGKRREVTHRYDPPWDCSGFVLAKEVGDVALLYLYETLGEWMEDELTGSQTATFSSGYGLSADDFEREIRDSIEHDIWESFHAYLANEEAMDIEEIICESDVYCFGVYGFANALVMILGQMKTDEVWKKFKDKVIRSRKLANDAARRRKEFMEALREKSKELKELKMPQITDVKIERPQWKEENLGAYLEQVLKEVDIEYVVAVAEVGLPGHFSNSVAADIQRIGKLVLESRKEEAEVVYFLGVVKDQKDGNNNDRHQ